MTEQTRESNEKQEGTMSKTQKSPTHRRPEETVMVQSDVVQSNTPDLTNGGLKALLESVAQPILAVTYWFDPEPRSEPYPVTIRFSGRRVDAKGRLQQRDRFVQDETIEKVIPGSGPVSITARVHDINPGEWVVTTQILGSAHSTHKARKQEKMPPIEVHSPSSIARLWHGWAPIVGSDEPVKTCLIPFARVPGIIPGIWGAMVALGMVVALVLQSLVISRVHLTVGPWWVVTLGGIGVGILGAKVWYIVLYRREHLRNGWCIQGFVTGATLTAAILLVVLRIPVGFFLDMTAPGLLIAMAIGRIGCFFAGCCGGPPTASRWGVWSSDQRVGARRIPTQLLELTLALSLGIGSFVVVLSHGPAGGAILVAALAAYTLVRQGILHLRAEPRKLKVTGPITATLSALILVVAIIFLVR